MRNVRYRDARPAKKQIVSFEDNASYQYAVIREGEPVHNENMEGTTGKRMALF